MTLPAATLAAWIVANPHREFMMKLAEVESGYKTDAVGRKGERGIFQFRYKTWQELHVRRNLIPLWKEAFDWQQQCLWATDKLDTDARVFSLWHKRQPTGPELYCMWNMGFSGFQKCGFDLRRVNKTTRKKAQLFDGIK